MRISVILAHPKKGSFNHAIADTVVRTLRVNGHKVMYHDLYGERFDPVLPYEEILKGVALNPAGCRKSGERLISISPGLSDRKQEGRRRFLY